jgi:hypothetical protein
MARSEYTARVVDRSRPVTSRRLRLAAAVEGQGIGELVDGMLDEHLPSDDQLAASIRSGGPGCDDAG